MIKTFNINLAGQIFNINEDAYEHLSGYFNSLRTFYANEEDKDEIIRDIEARFAELFLAKGKNYIVTLADTTEVVNMMGNPQEFDEEAKTENTSSYSSTQNSTTQQAASGKRLYRDYDGGLITGVCAGLSAYFGINDAIWLRLLFIGLTFIGIGSPILIYIILSLIMPKAETAAQKLEMKGEPVTLDNIVKSINVETVNVKSKGIFNQIISFFGAGIMMFFKVLLWIGIAFAIFIGSILVFSLFVAAIVFSVLALFGIPIANSYYFNNASDGWFFGIGGLLVFITPIIFGVVAIVHLLSKKVKPLKKSVVFPLVGLFFFGLLLLNISGFNAKKLVAEKKKINQTFPLNYAYKSDTIQLTINPEIEDEDYDNVNINGLGGLFDFINDHDDKFFPVEIEIYPSSSDSFTIVKEFSANGTDDKDAIKNATSYTHAISQNNNKLIIDPYIQFADSKVKFRNQKLKIKVYVPEGKVIRWDARTEKYMDVDKLAINWDNVTGAVPPMPPMPPLPPVSNHKIEIKTNKKGDSSSSKIVINIDSDNEDINAALDKAQQKLDEAREKIEEAENIDISDEFDVNFDERMTRQHYIFKMVNGELIAID
ncbi:MAG TPA: PspC domain-containing protein [Chitinophagales bacterium]|nr:PspC domain-containing protein [Chitinophagales bacterium]